MKEIREWLEKGHDYAQGVALYETHGTSRVVLTALRFGETAFTRQKLKAELTKLLDEKKGTGPPEKGAKPPNRQRAVEQPATAPPRGKGTKPIPEKEPSSPAVQEQRRAWFAERNHLHPQLELVATDAERLAMSLRILELADLISQSYELEAAPVAVHLATPGLAELAHEGEMRRLLANLRPQRTKLKKRPDRALDLAQVELDIKLLEEKLKKRDGGEPKL